MSRWTPAASRSERPHLCNCPCATTLFCAIGLGLARPQPLWVSDPCQVQTGRTWAEKQRGSWRVCTRLARPRQAPPQAPSCPALPSLQPLRGHSQAPYNHLHLHPRAPSSLLLPLLCALCLCLCLPVHCRSLQVTARAWALRWLFQPSWSKSFPLTTPPSPSPILAPTTALVHHRLQTRPLVDDDDDDDNARHLTPRHRDCAVSSSSTTTSTTTSTLDSDRASAQNHHCAQRIHTLPYPPSLRPTLTPVPSAALSTHRHHSAQSCLRPFRVAYLQQSRLSGSPRFVATHL